MNFSLSLDPIDGQNPCGPNLEYDPEYLLLLSKLQPKEGAQYGDFIDAPVPINWTEIQKECMRLLTRSIDIPLLIVYARCLTRTQHAEGFAEGLRFLQAALEKYPEDINPPKTIDGEEDLLVRANALSGLTDGEGFLGDLREMVLVKNTALRLQMRDVERAFLVPRPNDALSVESVIQQVQDLLMENNPNIIAIFQGYDALLAIDVWAKQYLGADAPDFSVLIKLFAPFQRTEILQYKILGQEQESGIEEDGLQQANGEEMTDSVSDLETEEVLDSNEINLERIAPRKDLKSTIDPKVGRRLALEEIKKVRFWFELHEPSSPVILFLKQAEKSVGKRFSEVVKSIPLDLLEQWDSNLETDSNEAN